MGANLAPLLGVLFLECLCVWHKEVLRGRSNTSLRHVYRFEPTRSNNTFPIQTSIMTQIIPKMSNVIFKWPPKPLQSVTAFWQPAPCAGSVIYRNGERHFSSWISPPWSIFQRDTQLMLLSTVQCRRMSSPYFSCSRTDLGWVMMPRVPRGREFRRRFDDDFVLGSSISHELFSNNSFWGNSPQQIKLARRVPSYLSRGLVQFRKRTQLEVV